MASSHRLSRPLTLATKTSSPYICTSCRTTSRLPANLRLHNASQQIRHNSTEKGEIPLTEKIRRKLWGTDNPPGLKDPYGGPGMFERAAARRREAAAAANNGVVAAPVTETFKETRLAPAVPEQRAPVDDRMGPQLLGMRSRSPLGPYEPAETWDGLEWVGEVPGDYKTVQGGRREDLEPYVATLVHHVLSFEGWLTFHLGGSRLPLLGL
jgi:hypothetical protein